MQTLLIIIPIKQTHHQKQHKEITIQIDSNWPSDEIPKMIFTIMTSEIYDHPFKKKSSLQHNRTTVFLSQRMNFFHHAFCLKQ